MSIAFWEVSKSGHKNIKTKEFNNPFDQNIDQSPNDVPNDTDHSRISEINPHPKIEITINDKTCNSNCVTPCNLCTTMNTKPCVPMPCLPAACSKPINSFNKFERCADLKCKLAHAEEKIKELTISRLKLIDELSLKENALKLMEERVADIKLKIQNLKCD